MYADQIIALVYLAIIVLGSLVGWVIYETRHHRAEDTNTKVLKTQRPEPEPYDQDLEVDNV